MLELEFGYSGGRYFRWRADFAMAAAGFDARHHPAGGGDDGDAEAAEDAGNVLPPAELAESGLGVAPDAADDGLGVLVVFQGDAQDLARVALDLEVDDVTFVLEHLGDIRLHAGRGHLDDFKAGALCVADSGEHVRDGI